MEFQEVEQSELFLRRIVTNSLLGFLAKPPSLKWSPLGFATTTLETTDTYKLRLNFWPSKPMEILKGQPSIHRHAWDLSSMILSGCYSECLVTVDGAGEYRQNTIRYNNDATESASEVKSKLGIAKSELHYYFPGQIHHVSAGVFHETFIPIGIATLTFAMIYNFEGSTHDNLSLHQWNYTGWTRPYLDSNSAFEFIQTVKSVLEQRPWERI
jgi:hypothetical protein